MKTWLIADTHFGHRNIIAYENRPFQTEAEMDDSLLENWNAVVSKDDKVFIVGDFAAATYEVGQVKELLAKLYGYKILVMGNHDRHHSVSTWLSVGFNEVTPYPIVVDDFYIMSHEPLYVNNNMPYANIYGHVHGNPSYKDCSSQSFCVSAERIGYTPIDFAKVKLRIKEAAT